MLAAFPFHVEVWDMDDIGIDEVLAYCRNVIDRPGRLRASPGGATRQDLPTLQQGDGLGREVPLLRWVPVRLQRGLPRCPRTAVRA